jgi:hypothetical protein
MLFPNARRVLSFAALAISVSFAGCSQGNTGSALPSNVTAQNVVASSSHAGIAKQAQAMRNLIHGANHAVIQPQIGTAKLFVPVQPDAANVLYQSIVFAKKDKLSSYISSLGFECCSTDEFGDAINLSASAARVEQVSVVLSSWGCQFGTWVSGCTTSTGATFSEPITLKIYSVTQDSNNNPKAGQVLVQQTKTFDIPYRPSADPRCQGPNAGAFVGKFDKECDNGLSYKATFNVKIPKTSLPQQVIATVAYNTSDSGYQPYGQNTQCFGSSGGCGYDSLNVSADGPGGAGNGDGTPIDPNGVQVYFTNPYFYCNSAGGNGSNALQDDTPCWSMYHPGIEITGTGGTEE